MNQSYHESPIHQSAAQEEPVLAELADRSRFGCLAGAAVIAVIVVAIVGPLIYLNLPAEINRWRIASADEKRLNGDMAGAIQDLDQAIQRSPEDVQLIFKRAQWQVQAENYAAALEDCNLLLRLRPTDFQAFILRSQVYQYLGRHAEALADCKAIMELDIAQTTTGRPHMLNLYAYARALANIELEDGLKDIDEALRRAGEGHEMLDTRGFLYYRQGDYERALNDLNRSVVNANEDYELLRKATKEMRSQDPRELKQLTHGYAKALAVILYHRGLVHQARGDKEAAETDFQRVRELGFEPNEKLF
jgi:tetratricopeptide (TPR) repeat protein